MSKRLKTILAAILGPLVLYLVLSGATHLLIVASGRDGLEISGGLFELWLFASIAISEIVGFVFLARAFRRFAIPLALVYFPAMFVFLMWCGLLLSASTGNGP